MQRLAKPWPNFVDFVEITDPALSVLTQSFRVRTFYTHWENPSVDGFEDGIEKTSSVLNSVIYCKVISCSCDFYPQRNFYNHGAIKRRTRPFCKLGISSQEEIRLEIEVNLWRKKIKVSIFEKLFVLPRISKAKNTTFKQVSRRSEPPL